jgi:hypothetical protein
MASPKIGELRCLRRLMIGAGAGAGDLPPPAVAQFLHPTIWRIGNLCQSPIGRSDDTLSTNDNNRAVWRPTCAWPLAERTLGTDAF